MVIAYVCRAEPATKVLRDASGISWGLERRIYSHVLKRGGGAVKDPAADRLGGLGFEG